MKTFRLLALALAALLLSSAPAFAATIRGVWEFSNAAALGAGTLPGGGASPTLTVEGTAPTQTASLGDGTTTLSGVITTVAGPANRLRLTHGIAPNGGSVSVVRQYSLLFDVFSPAGSRAAWRCFFQTTPGNNNDGEYFIRNDNNKLGTAELGYTTSELDEAHWARVVIVVDLPSVKVYVNGALFYTHANQALDGRYALESQLLLFADENGENAALNVGAVAMWSGALTGSEVAALAGPGGANIGVNQPPPEIVVEQPAGTELGEAGVLAWGGNDFGQTTVPAGVQSGVTAIAAGGYHTVALKSDGSVVAWGNNDEGQTTVPAGAQTGVTAIAAGGFHTVALKSDGSVVAWGNNDEGQTTVPAGAQTGVTAIAAGGFHTVALKSNGTVVAWGRNFEGQTTVPAGAQSGVVAVAAGFYHTVALKSNGSVLAWGLNDEGQTTVPAGAQAGVIAIAAGSAHTLALKSDGSVVAWGLNSSGQTAVPAGAQSGVTAIAGGNAHTVALKSDGSVVAWGLNGNGQTTVPAGAQSGVVAIAAGREHTVALVASAPPSVTFSAIQPLGIPSAAKSFVVKNTGTTPLALTSVSVTGGQAGEFTVDTTGMLASVPAGGQTTFSVTFTPSAAGARVTTLRIVNDDPNENPFDIALTGTGVVDTTAPETTITSANPTPVSSTTRTITFTGTDNIAVTSFEGRLDGAAFATVASPVSLSGLGDGSHTYEVRARDASGNVDATPASVTWVVDTTPPTFSLPGNLSREATGAAGAVVTYTASASDAGSGVVSSSFTPTSGSTFPITTTTVSASATDNAGNVASGSFTVTVVDTTPPTVTVPGNITVAATSTAGAAVTFAVSASDLVDGAVTATANPASGSTFPIGDTTVLVTAVDSRGNSGSGSFLVTVTSAPEIAVEQPAGTDLAAGVVAWGLNADGQTNVPAGAQTGVTAIAAGYTHTLALKNNASVLAWGYNNHGQTTVPAGAQFGVTAIAGGNAHTVALKSDGSVLAWGLNTNGQTTVPAGAQSGVTAIAAGRSHTVALKSDGSMIAWGENTYGQTTVPAGAQSGVVAIAAGEFHTVALKSDGSVLAWGFNANGQTTVPAGAQSGVTAIAAGFGHTLALKSNGSVVAWGLNANGQATVPAGAQSGVTAIAGGLDHSVALKSDGSVVAWGSNTFGQTTVPAGAQTRVTAIAAGLYHTVALVTPAVALVTPTVAFASQLSGTTSAAKSFVVKNTGTSALALSGVSVTGGQFGDFTVDTTGMLASVPAGGQTTFSVTFTPSAAGTRATTLRIVNNDANENPFDITLTGTGVADTTAPETTITSANPTPTNNTTRTITFTGTDNVAVTSFEGRLDGATFATVTSPVSLSGLANGSHTYEVRARDASGNVDATPASVTWVAETPDIAVVGAASVVAWGLNADGQTTVPAGAQTGVTAIAAGYAHTLALKSDGSVRAWGYNNFGQTTVPAGAQSGVTAIAAGNAHTVALKSDGRVVAWGLNTNGQTTVPAGALSGVTAIAAGRSHTVALKSNGSVIAWGENTYGQTTVPAGAQSGVVAIAAGQYHTVALKNDGRVVAWGYNANGQTTVPAGAQSGVIAIAAGFAHTLALKSNGSVVAWGYNANGQATVPAGAQSGVTAIAGGIDYSVALKSDGSVVAWGSNTFGQTTVPAGAQSGVTAIAAGLYHTVALVASAPPSTAFAIQPLGIPSAAKSFVVKNTGTSALALSGVSVTGGQDSDFTVDTTGMLASVPAGGQTTFSVTFTPSAAGAHATTLRIVNDDPDENPFDIALTGTGVVDTTAPETTITSANPTPVSSTTRTITFTGTDNIAVTSFEGRLDGAAFATVTSPVSLSGLGDGSHTYEVRARDASGNVDATPASVTWVVETTPPTLSLPGNLTREATGATGAVVTYTASASDAGSGVASFTSNPSSGSTFPITTTTVNASATDHAGNMASGSFTVTVVDSTAPTVTVPGNLTVAATSTAGAAVTFAVSASDLVDGAVTATATPASGSTFPIGDTTVLVTAVDSRGNSGSGSFLVTVTSAPEMVVEQTAGTALVVGAAGALAWGGNDEGQTTVPAGAQLGVTAIAGGGYHTVALKSDGSVLAWGLNDEGQTTVPAGAQSGVTAIAAGSYHTVALKSNGSVLAWGSNLSGQTTVPAGAQSGVIAIAAGAGHTVALKSDGSVLAWGDNFSGQTTVPAGAQSGVIAIAAGFAHTVALKSDGSVLAWGFNGNGQTTVPAGAQSGVTAIAGGFDHSVALKSDGSVLAWGDNSYGQATVPAGAQSGVIAIAGGSEHSVALKSNGSVVAWGLNLYGQTTVPAGAQTRVIAIAAGPNHTVALVASAPTVAFASQALGGSATKSFVVKNTGTAPLALSGVTVTGGQAGDFTVNTTGMLASVPIGGQTTFSVTFTPGALGTRATTLRIVNDDPDENPFDIALTGTGTVDTTAPETTITSANPTPSNSTSRTITFTATDDVAVTSFEGRLDGAAFATVASPVSLSGLGDGSHTYEVRARDAAGNVDATPASVTWAVETREIVVEQPAGMELGAGVVAWGLNANGQTTVPAGAQSGVAAIATGYVQTLALKSDGSVLAWGFNNHGQTTVPAGAQSGVTAFAGGNGHMVALKSDGSVLAWGLNANGQTTVPAGAQSGVVAIAAGQYHTVALKSDGSVVAWGLNSNGQTTVPAGAQSGVMAIAAGDSHTVALQSDGSVLAWGGNTYGQTTVPAGAQSGVIAIAAGHSHTLALKSNGSVVAWGYNANGQTTVPAGAQSGVTAIAGGLDHSVALKSDGSVVAWGSNTYGQTTVPAGAQTRVTAIAAGLYHTVALVAKPPIFASQGLGIPSAAKSFVVKNTGTTPLALTSVSVTGGQAGDFTVDTTGMLASVPAGGQTTFSVTFTPGAAGARATTLRIVNDDANENPFDIALTGTGVGVFPAWATTNGVANDPQALGANGLENRLNFAFAIHPVTGGPGPLQYAGPLAGGGTIAATGLPLTVTEPGDRRALFVRRKDRVAAGLTYTPQFSSTLATWQASDEPTVLADDGVNQIVSVPYPALGPGETRSFFRVTVSLAP